MADLDYIIKFASDTLGLDRANSAISKVGVGLAALGVGFATFKAVGFLSDAVKGAADFEQQLATVQAVSGSTVEQMNRIKDASIELGKTTRYNATQAAEGFEILARAGLDTEASLKTIPSVLALAQGNSLGLAEAAGFVTKAVQGMGLEFSEAGRVADVLAKASASANTDVSGLGAALSYAAPTAASLGITIEETAAYIGKFADAGVDASRAGTAFNGILSQFGNSASTFKRELANINITTDDFNLAIRQLAEAGPKGQKAIQALGLEAGPAFKALLAQGIDSLDELTGKLYEAGGAAESQAETMNNTWQGALAGLDSAWSTLKDTLGESFLDDMTQSFKDLATEIISLVDSGKVKEFGKSVADEFKKATTYVIEFVRNVDMAELLDKVSNSLSYLQTVATGANGAFQALSISVNAMKNGLLAIGVVTSMVITIFADLLKMAVDAGNALDRFFGTTSESMVKFSDSLGGVLQSSEDFRKFADEEMAKTAESMGASMRSIAGEVDKTAEVTVTAAEKMADSFNAIVDDAFEGSQKTSDAINQIRENLSGMVDGFDSPDQFADLIDLIIETGNEAVVGAELLSRLGVAAADGTEQASASADKAVEAVTKLGNAAQEQAEAVKTAISGTFSALNIDVQQNLNGVNTKTQQTFDLIANGAKSVAESTYSATEKAQLLSALFAEGLNAAKTKEEFAALNDVTKHYGLSAVITADQQKILQAGMKGGSDAIVEQSEALLDNTETTKTNTNAVSKNSEARKEQSTSTWNASFATDAAALSDSKSLEFMSQVTGAIRDKIGALTQMGATTEQVNGVWDNLISGYEGQRFLGIQDFTDKMQRVDDIVNEQVESFTQAKARADDMASSLSGASVTSEDLADAQFALRQATDANVEGLIRMDDQTLSNLQNAIDSARERMQGLSDDAKNTADNLEATLAKLQGNEDRAREIEQAQKLADIEEQLNEAKARGNSEEVAQLNRALSLQKQINTEEDKKARSDSRAASAASKAQAATSQSAGATARTVDINLKLGGSSAPISIPESQESSFMVLLKELEQSKAIAGY